MLVKIILVFWAIHLNRILAENLTITPYSQTIYLNYNKMVLNFINYGTYTDFEASCVIENNTLVSNSWFGIGFNPLRIMVLVLEILLII